MLSFDFVGVENTFCSFGRCKRKWIRPEASSVYPIVKVNGRRKLLISFFLLLPTRKAFLGKCVDSALLLPSALSFASFSVLEVKENNNKIIILIIIVIVSNKTNKRYLINFLIFIFLISSFPMTEKLLLIRSAATSRYFILGTDFPCARVFDSSTSSLIGVLKPERLGVGLLSTETLTSVAVGPGKEEEGGLKNCVSTQHKEEKGRVLLQDHYAVAGFSNGTILVHHVEANTVVAEVLVSPTQQPVQCMAVCGEFVWCLTADHKVSVVELQPPQGKGRPQSVGPPEEMVRFRFSCHADVSSLTVIQRSGQERSGADLPTEASSASLAQGMERVFEVLVSGTSTTLYVVSVHRNAASMVAASAARRHAVGSLEGVYVFRVEESVSFASQGSTVSFSWLSQYPPHAGSSLSVNHSESTYHSRSHRHRDSSTTNFGRAAITASPQDTTIRIWDVQPSDEPLLTDLRTTENVAALQARCRRTLVCGQRIAHVSVREGQTYCFVAATTFTGAVLVWAFRGGFLPPLPEPLPISPDMIWYSPVPVAKLLMCELLPSTSLSSGWTEELQEKKDAKDKSQALESLSALLLRGSFALPHFDRVRVHQLPSPSTDHGTNRVAAERTYLSILASLAIAPTGGSTLSFREWNLREVPLSTSFREALELQQTLLSNSALGGGEAAAFEALDRLWSKQRMLSVVSTKASMTPTEAFPIATPYRAASMTALPIKKMTLEQRLRELAKLHAVDGSHDTRIASRGTASDDPMEDDLLPDARTGSVGNEGIGVSASAFSMGSLGMASVPLYQALHANDVSAVMELLSVASRSAEGVRATVMSLQLPYCLQLLTILSERLGICSRNTSAGGDTKTSNTVVVGGGLSAISSRAPLLQWIDAIIQYRGMEIHDAQIAYDAIQQLKQEQGKRTVNEDGAEVGERLGNHEVENTADTAAMMKMMASPPKAFIAPILHEYRRMTSMYDTLATLHGRMGVFLGVRPSEKNRFYNRSRKMLSSNIDSGREDTFLQKGLLSQDIIFPATFAEVASRKKSGNYVVKVKSKAATKQERYKKRTSDIALLREAEKRAAEALRNERKEKSLLDDEDNDDLMDDIIQDRMAENGGELDLDELEGMNVDDEEDEDEEGDGENDGNDQEEEEEDSDNRSHKRLHKRSRKENAKTPLEEEMLADQPSEDEAAEVGLHSDSAAEEFSEGSDEDEDSNSTSFSSEDEDEDVDSLSSMDVGADNSDDDDDDDDEEEDDGIGEDMTELLKASGGDSSSKGEEKRIRVD